MSKQADEPEYGPIRFVDGPWHNRIESVRWLPIIRIPCNTKPLVSFEPSQAISPRLFDSHLYELRAMWSNYSGKSTPQARFLEYHYAGCCPGS